MSKPGEVVELLDAYCINESEDHGLTATSLTYGRTYGHPDCYLLQVGYQIPVIGPAFPPGIPHMKASFLLETVKG